jgi:hypothetical protein
MVPIHKNDLMPLLAVEISDLQTTLTLTDLPSH